MKKECFLAKIGKPVKKNPKTVIKTLPRVLKACMFAFLWGY